MEFCHFWGENIAHAWHLGHGFFWEVESIVTIVSIIIGVVWKIARKRRVGKAGGASHDDHELPKDHWWHRWENKIMVGGLGVSVLVFLFAAVFVAPFQRYEEAEKSKNTLTMTNANLVASNLALLEEKNGLEQKLEIETRIAQSKASRPSRLDLSPGAYARIKEKLKALSDQGRKIELSVVFSINDENSERMARMLDRLFRETNHKLDDPEFSYDRSRGAFDIAVGSQKDTNMMAFVEQFALEVDEPNPKFFEVGGDTNTVRFGIGLPTR